MRQAHSYPPNYAKAVPRPTTAARQPAWRHARADEGRGGRYEATNPLITVIGASFSIVWFLVTLPFRLVMGTISLLGRLTGIAVGFTLMAVGMAFCAGPFFIIGVPMFLIGLLLTLRSLG